MCQEVHKHEGGMPSPGVAFELTCESFRQEYRDTNEIAACRGSSHVGVIILIEN